MADRQRFHEEPGLTRLDTAVIESGRDGERPWVRLEETIFYPEGGGQPPDRGTINGVPVLDVQSRGGRILHFVERPVPEGAASLEIDAALRYDRMQQHTAQHLLTAILLDRHGLPTTAFHLGERYTAIEVAGPVPSPERLQAIEDEVNREIRLDRPVRDRWVAPEELGALPVRSRGLPEGLAGNVRLVEIEGIDLNTCGGTHVARLGEIQLLRIVDAGAARGGTRISFLAGGRVLRELREFAAVEAALKARIGTSREEFAGVLDAWEEERKRLERRAKELERDLAARIASELGSQAGALLARFVGDAGPDFLRVVANAAVARRPEATVALVGAQPDGREACFLVQSGPSGPEDVSPTGRKLAELLGAKGGGKGRTFQGRGGRWPGDPSILLSL